MDNLKKLDGIMMMNNTICIVDVLINYKNIKLKLTIRRINQ